MILKNFFLSVCIVFILGVGFADTDGVWHEAEDIRPGLIGSDEVDGDYIFEDSVVYKGIELDSRYVNENQPSSISSSMIVDGTISVADTDNNIDLAVLWKHQRNTDDRIVSGAKVLSVSPSLAKFNGNLFADKFCLNNGAGCLTFNGIISGGSGGSSSGSGSGVGVSNYWNLNGDDVFRATGKVGIGTDSPGAALEVIGQTDEDQFSGVRIRTGDSVGAPGVTFYRQEEEFVGAIGVATRSGHFSDDSNSGDIVVRSALGGDVRLTATLRSKEFDTKLIVKNNGNVGIGIDNPASKLHVVGNVIASNPTQGNHLATKSYVDSVAGGGSGGGSSGSSEITCPCGTCWEVRKETSNCGGGDPDGVKYAHVYMCTPAGEKEVGIWKWEHCSRR